MAELLPIWNAVGAEPPAELKTTGWQPGMKPSAQHMNWLFNRIYKCLEEIQAGGGTEELERGLAALQSALTTHLDEKASLIKVGHVQLSNELNGTSEEKAITEKALSDALKTVVKNIGGKMTGNLTIENGAPIFELSETDTGEKYFIVADGGSFSIRKNNTGDSNYAFKLDDGKAFVFSSKVMTEMMKNVPGGYAGLDSKGKIQDAQLSDSVVYTNKYLKVRHTFF